MRNIIEVRKVDRGFILGLIGGFIGIILGGLVLVGASLLSQYGYSAVLENVYLSAFSGWNDLRMAQEA